MKILIVDDHQDVADSLAMVMRLKGHNVSVHYTAREGISEAKRSQPEVILHDIAMPGMSGYDAIRCLRQDPALKEALIVAITAYNTSEHRQRAKEAGFDHLMVKPPDLEALLSLIDALGSKR